MMMRDGHEGRDDIWNMMGMMGMMGMLDMMNSIRMRSK